ncbi:GntR family transcriptional regulator [Carnobacterium pleistocenium]|uniref:GntR family transcriptional regulator n=1 Tax=Carnobacterium pleistocenium TaxID=181073 RepID=UPI000A7B17AB|nr:winged helix-turn-helix domain-containing protein [Carnobacterium pleistocenium]
MNKWSINQAHSMPLYQKIMLLTEEKIKSGELKPGTRLPSERKLAEYLKVNRSTVIHAMEELTAQGVLARKKGSGTYVNPDKWGLQTKSLINWGTSLTTDSFKKKVTINRLLPDLGSRNRTESLTYPTETCLQIYCRNFSHPVYPGKN